MTRNRDRSTLFPAAAPASSPLAVSVPFPASRIVHGPRAFTLIELVVVIAIIILLIAIAVPAVGPALVSNYRTQATAALNSCLATAQTYALSHTTDVGIRIERAVELDNYGRMVKPDGVNPKYLDYQQIRYVIFNKSPEFSREGFRYIKDSKITALPSAIWFAPTNFYTDDDDPTNDFGPTDLLQLRKNDKNDNWLDPDKTIGYYPFDTFYIVFSSTGMLKTFPRENLFYIDETQQVESFHPPMIQSPQDSATGVLLYERKKLANAPNGVANLFEFLQTNGSALYINRFLGTTVESQ